MTIKVPKNELFGWYIGENINKVYDFFIEIYHDGQSVLAGEFEVVMDHLDEYYFHSRIQKLVKKDNILKFYLTH